MFRQAFRKFLAAEIVPHMESWRAAGIVDRSAFRKAGEQGFLMVWPEERFGGSGDAGETIDVTGLDVLPGVIDSQVHFREPGLEHKEDLESGSVAAVMGGVTAVFEMPNTIPLTTSAETLADKVKRGEHRMHCDFAFFIGGTRENVQDLPELDSPLMARLMGVARSLLVYAR